MTERNRMKRANVLARRQRLVEVATRMLDRLADPLLVRELAIKALVQDGIDAELRGIGVEFIMEQRIKRVRAWLQEKI